ncbi:FAD-dependent monooxygenase [Propionivibrio sp.]|uniref:FAD-dependent monooxygenase n=1 Tax=Propionivibrio sp. TaxID=2212460 RepID=UPI0026393A87|nr:FAD-dependent monooxygenase [Propionivibrio sp.]
MTDPTALDTDVLIIGAGPVGMALALSLADSTLRVLLIDARRRDAWADDPRALALAHGSQQLLEGLHAWNARAGTAISEIHVSQRGGFGRTLLTAKDYGAPALGYVMPYRDLAAALAARIAPGQLISECVVDSIETGSKMSKDQITATLAHQGAAMRITAKLIVHAEGTPEGNPDIRVRDYHQHAIVAQARPASPHHNRAWERFTPDGPLALLPLGQDYSVVFTAPADKAARLLAYSDEAFLAALREQFGKRLDFVSCGPRSGFPLALRVRSQITRPRQVWIGNCAQTLHPVSGQGFNLGLRDAIELATALLDHGPDDAGNTTALAAYARGRRIDRRYSMAFTDSIVRLFSNDLAPLRCARGLGLLALDLYPPLRHFVAKRMIWGARAWP